MSNLIVRLSFLCCLLLTVSVPANSQAATLHAILVADTEDGSIGDSVTKDIGLMTAEVKAMAQYTGMDTDIRVLTGRRFDGNRVWHEVVNPNCSADDVIVFYYSGHGYRVPQKPTQWPILFFDWTRGCLDLHTVATELQTKGAHLCLVLADCCNNTMNSGPWYKGLKSRSRDQEHLSEQYRFLLGEYEGVLLVSSSSVGEYSYALEDGGMFTLSLLDNVHEAVLGESVATWSNILQGVSKDTSYAQHPQFTWLD